MGGVVVGRGTSGSWRQRVPGRGRLPRLAVLGALVLGLVLGVAPASPAATSTAITSAGPLTNIAISTELNCAVNHIGDAEGEFFEDTACATELATGGLLFGPSDIPGGNNPGGFDPVSQSGVTGSGTAADPYTIVTVVDAVGVSLRLTETDSYVVGEETYTTRVAIANSGSQARDGGAVPGWRLLPAERR